MNSQISAGFLRYLFIDQPEMKMNSWVGYGLRWRFEGGRDWKVGWRRHSRLCVWAAGWEQRKMEGKLGLGRGVCGQSEWRRGCRSGVGMACVGVASKREGQEEQPAPEGGKGGRVGTRAK